MMMQIQASFIIGRLPSNGHDVFSSCNLRRQFQWCPIQASSSSSSSPAINGEQNHYLVLGVARSATSADIKKAYRLLARKYHPDVSKESQATEVFMSIHHAYEVLSNEATKIQYDQALNFQEKTGRSYNRKWNYASEYEDTLKTDRWAEMRRRTQKTRYRKYYNQSEDNFSFNEEPDEEVEEEEENRGPFSEVLMSAFLSLFLLRTIGSQLSLTFSALTAFFDHNLDAGYKIGYTIAWILGGSTGILLTMCLSFASWLCGKSSSGVVALVVVAMWVGSNLARFALIPQGALLTLLFMSIKLQIDLK